MLAFGKNVFPCTLVVKHMIHFRDSFNFDIWYWYCWWMKNCCFEEVNCLFECLLCWSPGAFIERNWQRHELKNYIYNDDLRRNHHFKICSWVLNLGCIEELLLVNCGNFPIDSRSIYAMRSNFRYSEDENVLFEVIADTFISM